VSPSRHRDASGEHQGAGAFVPRDAATLADLAAAAQHCRGCHTAYKTNAVKHFRWKPAPGGGKRRIHERPDTWQVRACWPWLEAELARLAPGVVVTLGATAGQALFGNSFRVTSARGTQIRWSAPGRRGGEEREVTVVPTIHPSAVLRAEDRDGAYAGLVSDLRVAAAAFPGRRAG
jgi:uracil-DNA glycosylase